MYIPQVCIPSPCGANAICKERNGVGSCICLSNYIGNPYEGCRPECTINSDCIPSKACVQSRCQDPCPGTCGQNAICQVVNHIAICTCIPKFTGDPFRYCSEESTTGIILLALRNINIFDLLFLFKIYDLIIFYCNRTFIRHK